MSERQMGYGLSVIVCVVVIAVVGILVALVAKGPEYPSSAQIDTYMSQQPAECRVLARSLLRKRILEQGNPLRHSDVRTILHAIDQDTCEVASRQLGDLAEMRGTSVR